MRFKRMSCSVAVVAMVAALASAVTMVSIVTAPAAQAIQADLPANIASSWQTNGRVNAIGYAKGVVYLGGDFTRVRPPGSGPGQNEVARNYLAAFNANTGALITSFNPGPNAAVHSLAASPDGSVIYAGGDFTSVGNASRTRLAAFTTANGALTSFAPAANGRVRGLAVSNDSVYIGGSFSRIGTTARARVAAVTLSGALRTDFAPTVDNVIYKIALSQDFGTLYLAGAFSSTNGDPTYQKGAALATSNGELRPFPAISVVPIPSPWCVSELKDVTTDGDTVYFAAEGTGGGCFDGVFAAHTNDGTLKWVSQCLGATQNVTRVGNQLYTGSHAHDCTNDMGFDPDAFPEVGWNRGLSRHLLARDINTGKLAAWYPNTNGGPGGSGLGPRVSATDGTQLFIGGEFTYVNGQAQQGFARFSPSTGDLIAPDRPARPVAVARAEGNVTVYVQAPVDISDTDIIVRLFRDGGSTPIATAPAHSLFWRQPILAFEDNGLAIGSRHTYTADAVEANGGQVGPRSVASDSVTVTNTVGAYADAVTSDAPSFFWRLGEPAGPVAADSSGGLSAGMYYGNSAFGLPGAITDDSDRSIRTDGSTGFVASAASQPGPTTYSVEAWINTTTTSGGRIVGFGNRQGGYDFGGNPALSSNYDRHVYMTNDGRLVFGTYNGGFHTVTTADSFNDGAWHHIVATQGPSGMTLYVDGVRRGTDGWASPQPYNGFWRVGGDNLGGWPSQPASHFFAGQIDDVSVYPTALSKTQVVAHYVAAGRTPPPTTRPADAYGRAVYDDEPTTYWRLDETSGTTAADTSDNGATGNYVGGVSLGAPQAIEVGTGVTLDGTSGNVVSSSPSGGPSTYSAELWFATSTTRGGKLLGFGNAQTGLSSSYDKQIYMTNAGHLIFGVYNGGFDLVTSPTALNDGQWHHVVATQDATGMRLYIDDQLAGTNGASTNQAYQGYWRVGGDSLNWWPDQPTSHYFAGNIDEVAIYGSALSAARVDAHYTASGRTGPDTIAPVVSISAPVDGSTVTTGPVTITVDATDARGVASVEFLVDGAVVATDTTAPYSTSWTATAGSHVISARAHDAAGNVGTATPVTVTALAPDTTAPMAQITSPAAGASVYGPTPVTVTAADDRGVVSVEFYVDGALVGTDMTAPYEFVWDATVEGAHSLHAIATDAAGNDGQSASVQVTVPADTTAPGAPPGLTAGTATTTTVPLSWSAATDDRGVVGYRVVRDGTVLPGTVSGLSWTDTGLSAGTTYTYTVRAVDAAGNVSADSDAVTVQTQATNPLLYSDTWSGADGSAWNGAWATGSSTSGAVTIQNGAGRLALDDVAGAYARAQLTGATAETNAEVLLSYTWGQTSAISYTNIWLRGTGGWQNAYRPRTGYGVELSSRSGTIALIRNVNGTMATLGTYSGAQQVTTAKQWLRLSVSGNTIRVRIWADGQTEPSTWTAAVTDSAVTEAGQLYISSARGGANVGAKTFDIDDLALRGL